MEKSNDIVERLYWTTKSGCSGIAPIVRTAIIRIRKFLALPYCYFRFVDWDECQASRFQVILDFLYIFFKLKYYPENYGYCRLWDKDRDSWKYYYGSNYDAYQSFKLGKEVQRKEYQILFKDKEVCHQMCTGAGLPMPQIYGVLDPNEDYVSRLRDISSYHDKLIIKPVIGHGGYGVQLVTNVNGSILIGNSEDRYKLDKLEINERHLIQEFIEHDDRLSILTSSASIRIVTLYTRSGEVIVMNSEVNTAVDNNIISNWSAGGVAISVDIESGRLNETGFDKQGRMYHKHPTSDIKFSEYVIPDWSELVRFAISIQKAFPYYRILGPDITLSPNGPMLYEINATPDLAGSEQSNGPLLANKKVLEEFKRYDLLINDAFDD